MPVGAASYSEGLRWSTETYHALKGILAERGMSTAVGDEGGFAPDLPSNEDAIRLLLEAIEKAGRVPATRSPSHSTPPPPSSGGTALRADRGGPLARLRRAGRLLGRAGRPLSDRLDRGRDGRGGLGRLEALTDAVGDRVQLVGDDLFVTNPERIERGIELGVANAVLDQAQSDRHAHRDHRRRHPGQSAAYGSVISHRSGETEDTTVADLVVALGPAS